MAGITDELIGKTIGGYVIEGQVGRGGMATVYLARQTSMNRVVALKVLPKNLTEDEAYSKRFEREVSIVAQLEHRSIVPVYDHGEFDGQPYIAMRYMAGGSLDHKLASGPLKADYVLDIYAQVAPALDYAHGKGVLHRDLKPSNVLLDETGGAFITDFGIARIIGDPKHTPTITTQGVVGTPSYMSPEQAQGQPMDGRSDLYAMGVMLFELLTGRRPFQSDTPYSIAVMQVTAPPPSARALNPDISPAVEQVIFKTLKKRPEERYPTAAEMVEALRLAVENPGGFNPHDTQPHKRPVAQETQPVPVTSVGPMPAAKPSTSPPSSAPMPQPVYNPTPPRTGSDYMPAPVSSSISVARPFRRRKQGNMWMGMTIGALIGCGLLTLLAVVMVMVASQLIDRLNPQSRAADTPDTPTPTQTSEASREASQATATESPPRETEVSEAAATSDNMPAPIGVRESMDGRLVFVTDVQQGVGPVYSQIFTRALRDDIAATQLTRATANHRTPVVSNDGQRVAFVSDRDGDFDLYVMDVGGANVRQVLDTPVDEFAPAWTPDDSALIFASDTRGDGATSLLSVSLEEDGVVKIVYEADDARAYGPAVSPDGTRIALVKGGPRDARTWEIVLLNLETGGQILLTENDERDTLPVFSPDGQWIYWLSGSDGEASIWRIPADLSTEAEQIYSAEQFISSLTFNPDGALLLFTQGDPEEPVGTLYTLEAAGGDDPISLGIAYALNADWTP